MEVARSTNNVVENSRGQDIVIEPSKIKEEFEKVERENYRLCCSWWLIFRVV